MMSHASSPNCIWTVIPDCRTTEILYPSLKVTLGSKLLCHIANSSWIRRWNPCSRIDYLANFELLEPLIFLRTPGRSQAQFISLPGRPSEPLWIFKTYPINQNRLVHPTLKFSLAMHKSRAMPVTQIPQGLNWSFQVGLGEKLKSSSPCEFFTGYNRVITHPELRGRNLSVKSSNIG